MDKFSGLPNWVQTSKKSLKQSQEWQTFMMKLYDLVHHQMQEMGVSSFNDLAPPERQLLLQRAFHALKSSGAYFHLLETVSESLDESISKEADKLSSRKMQNKTKIEILQEECNKAVTALLQKWPDSRSSLRQCLNANIPLELRYVIWKNFLRSPKTREEYLMLVATDPRQLVSQLDFEISEKCRMLLESDPTLKPIPNRKTVSIIMRHLLSYRHTKTGGALSETDILLAVPPVVCTLSAKEMLGQGNHNKQLTTEAMATLVEEFTAFMDKRPAYMMSTKGPSLLDLSQKTLSILHTQNAGLVRSIEGYKVQQKPNTKIEVIMQLLLHPIVRSMFVGYFPLETVLHVWDIIILGFDHPDYDPVPYLCATLFLLFHKDLMKCQSEKEAATVLIRGARSLHKEQLALALKEYQFEKQLKENLNIAEEDLFPVFHPTLKSNLPPWKHWYSDKILSHLQAEREGPKRLEPTESQPALHSNGHDSQAWHLDQMRFELEDETERLRAERDALAVDIEKERRLRVEVQQQADEEIERLRRQLNAAQRNDGRQVQRSPEYQRSPTGERTPTPPDRPIAVPTQSPEKEKTPTPSPKPESKQPTPQPKTPEATEPPEDKRKATKITDDFLMKMMETVSLLAHGNQKQKKELDRTTEKDMQKLSAAVRKAQINVYGRPMSDEEVLKLPSQDQKLDRLQEETMKILFKKK